MLMFIVPFNRLPIDNQSTNLTDKAIAIGLVLSRGTVSYISTGLSVGQSVLGKPQKSSLNIRALRQLSPFHFP